MATTLNYEPPAINCENHTQSRIINNQYRKHNNHISLTTTDLRAPSTTTRGKYTQPCTAHNQCVN